MSKRNSSPSPPPPWEISNERMQGEIDEIRNNLNTMMKLMTNMANDVSKLSQTQPIHTQTRNTPPSPHEPISQAHTRQTFDYQPQPRRHVHYHQRTMAGTPPVEEELEGSPESSSDADEYRRERRNSGDDREIKVDLPDFNGSLDPNDFIDWLHEIERVFEFKGYNEEKKCRVAILKFKGYASLWWENVRKKRERERKDKIRSWDKLKRVLKKRFLPDDYKQDLYLKLHHL